MLHKTHTNKMLMSLLTDVSLTTVKTRDHLGFLHPSVEELEVSKISSS